jgi:RimJ/RimL family protein N-acetyltransferase
LLKKALPWLRARSEPDGDEKLVFKGNGVVIRPKRLEDAPEDYAWRTDEDLARLDATRPIRMSYEDFVKYSKDELLYSSGTSRRLAIDTLDGRHIGNCMYYDIDVRRGSAELGIMIGDREYWGKGYGTDSVDAMLTHIFTATSLNLVYLHTLEWNHRARRSFAKSGMREVKKLRRGGLEFVLMEIARPRWEELSDTANAAADSSQDGHATSGENDGKGPSDE